MALYQEIEGPRPALPALVREANVTMSAGPQIRPESLFQPQQERTVRDYLFSLLRRTPQILLVGGGVAAAVFFLFAIQAKSYTATAVIIVAPGQSQILIQDPVAAAVSPDNAMIDSQVEVMRSPDLVQKLVQYLSLDKDPAWNPDLKPREGGLLSFLFPGEPSVVVAETPTVETPAGAGAASMADPLSPLDFETAEADIITEVTDALDIRRRGLTNVIDINVSAADPRQASRVANGLIDVFRMSGQNDRLETSNRNTDWLDKRLAELQGDVVAAEQAAQSFRVSSGLVSAGGASLTESQVSELQVSMLQARADVAEKRARYEQVESMVNAGGTAETLAGALNSEVVRDMRQREAELARRQIEFENTLGPLHPSVQNGRAELENIRGQIQSEVTRIQASLRNEYEISLARLRTIESDLAGQRRKLSDSNLSLVRLNELERTASVSRGVYEDFLRRSQELGQQEELQPSNINVVAKATPPAKPSSPNLLLGAALAIVLGGIIGLGLAIVMEWLDDGLRSGEDVERKIGAPSLASIPVLKPAALRLLSASQRHPAGYVVAKPLSSMTEAFRVLRMAISHATGDRSCKVVAITSALPGDGKTTTSLCLARVSAMSGLRVLLVDCDLRRRSLNALLDISPQKGLVEVLTGKIDWREVIGKDEASGATVLPLADESATIREVFGTPMMAKLIEELRPLYDLIILDCPPVLALAESRVLSTLADGTVIVARAGKTSARALNAVLDQLSAVGAGIIGVALNCVDPKSAGRSSYKEALYYMDARSGYYQE
jgi:capsular exopolysaccharide synthesis family protein